MFQFQFHDAISSFFLPLFYFYIMIGLPDSRDRNSLDTKPRREYPQYPHSAKTRMDWYATCQACRYAYYYLSLLLSRSSRNSRHRSKKCKNATIENYLQQLLVTSTCFINMVYGERVALFSSPFERLEFCNVYLDSNLSSLFLLLVLILLVLKLLVLLPLFSKMGN